LASLDHDQKRHAFTPYLSEEEQQTIKGFKLEGTINGKWYENPADQELTDDNFSPLFGNESPEAQLKAQLNNDEAAEFISKLVLRARNDMAYCLNVDPQDIVIDIRTASNKGDPDLTSIEGLFWHADGVNYEEVFPEDVSNLRRASMTLVGKPTLFSNDKPEIYKDTKDKVDGVRVGQVTETEEAGPGDVAVWTMDAAHAAPVIDGARLFVIFDYDPRERMSSIPDFQRMINTMAYEAAESIRQFNSTVPAVEGYSTAEVYVPQALTHLPPTPQVPMEMITPPSPPPAFPQLGNPPGVDVTQAAGAGLLAGVALAGATRWVNKAASKHDQAFEIKKHPVNPYAPDAHVTEGVNKPLPPHPGKWQCVADDKKPAASKVKEVASSKKDDVPHR